MVALGLVLIALAACWLRENAASIATALQAHALPATVGAFAAMAAFTRSITWRERRDIAQSWLAAAPLSCHEIERAIRARVGPRLLAPWLTLPLLLLACGTRIGASLAVVAAGGLLGLGVGWIAARRAPLQPLAVPPRLTRHRRSTTPSATFAALSRWPTARWLADADPRRDARLVGAVLLMLPMGVPLPIALLMVLLAASLIAAWGSLRALLATIPEASAWLRATPMAMPRLARGLLARSAPMLLGTLLCAGLCLGLLGLSLAMTVTFVAAALAWCVTAVLNALAWRHRPRRARHERLVLGLAFLLLFGSATWWLLPLLAASWLRDLRQARRT